MKFKFITLSDPYYRDELMLRWEMIEKPKGMPPGLLSSAEEKESYHLIALEKKQLVGCIVCHPQDKEGKIYHLALSDEYRGKPFSRQMLVTLEEFLVDKGISHVYVLAGEEMWDLYFHLGFRAEDIPFQDFGVSYQKMGKKLLASA